MSSTPPLFLIAISSCFHQDTFHQLKVQLLFLKLALHFWAFGLWKYLFIYIKFPSTTLWRDCSWLRKWAFGCGRFERAKIFTDHLKFCITGCIVDSSDVLDMTDVWFYSLYILQVGWISWMQQSCPEQINNLKLAQNLFSSYWKRKERSSKQWQWMK